MLVFLDRQHVGNPSRRKSMGAGADIDGDGKIELWEMESTWTAKYLLSAELRLRTLGHEVIPISDGAYTQRHKRANRYISDGEPSVYVAAHINAGGGSYGSVFYDSRSTKGPDLAACIAEAMKQKLPELAQDARAISCNPKDWTKNAWYTIRATKSVAVCFEPCFIDTRAHRPLFSQNGMDRIGWSLANGIDQYFKNL